MSYGHGLWICHDLQTFTMASYMDSRMFEINNGVVCFTHSYLHVFNFTFSSLKK